MRRWLVVPLMVLACTSNRPEAGPTPCRPTLSADSIRIAVPDSVDWRRLPRGRNESERLVQRQISPLACSGMMGIEGGVVIMRQNRPVLSFTWHPGTDARDLLDRGFDVVLTADTRALEYAKARPEFDVRPLPWSRTYTFVLKRGGHITWAEGPSVWRDAIPGDAQPVTGPFWWRDLACPDTTAQPGMPNPPAPPRMVYQRGDAAARGLAERFVARGVSLEPMQQRERVVALDATALRDAVLAGVDYAVVWIPRDPFDPCAAMAGAGLAGRSRNEVIPMLDTRLHLIIRRGRFGVSPSGDGIPLFDP
jgi:hypothetical protein